MLAFLSWYVLSTLLGLIGWVASFRLVPALPDRAYSLARVIGLLLVSYLYWAAGTFGLISTGSGGIVAALLLAGAAAAAVYFRVPDDHGETLADWLRRSVRFVLSAEAVFLAAFALLAYIRALNPDITGTEKPMEMAFLNGVRQSAGFPPQDPWLAGYAISYYYFGYIQVALMADLSGVSSGVAFNLGVALIFALTASGSYGLVYNLIMLSRPVDAAPGHTPRGALLAAGLAPLFVLILGNLMGLLDVVRALRLPLPPGFWAWLDIEEIDQAPAMAVWPPQEGRFLWWWRASRVIRDRLPNGEPIGIQPINEFPAFSFLLADMHPHVLALPFVLLTLALALNVLKQGRSLRPVQILFYALSFGGLAFLNTWDFPIYLFVLLGATALGSVFSQKHVTAAQFTTDLLPIFSVVGIGVLFYLPWYIGFTSQAGGFLPNLVFPTRVQQFIVMFGVFLPILAWYLGHLLTAERSFDWRAGLGVPALLLIGLLGVTAALVGLGALNDPGLAARLSSEIGAAGPGQALLLVLGYRLSRPVTALLLLAIIGVCAAYLAGAGRKPERSAAVPAVPAAFTLLLLLTAVLLTLGPEFIYLRDNFSARMNTIFKFYYAAWVMFALAAAYASYWLLSRLRQPGQALFAGLLSVLVGAGMLYPIFGLPARTGRIIWSAADPLQLDGLAYMQQQYPDDYAAIRWLAENAAPGEYIIEAVGGAYSNYGRVSALSGVPTLMGWANHQRQWRGESYGEVAGGREFDVEQIYATNNITQAAQLLRQYDVTYIFVGALERDPSTASGAGLAKFERHFEPVFSSGGTTIYRVTPARLERLYAVEAQP